VVSRNKHPSKSKLEPHYFAVVLEQTSRIQLYHFFFQDLQVSSSFS
jgi:hypothetical protein